MAIIKAPVPFSGVRANLVFVNGVSDTNDAWLIQWFKEHGYEVTEQPEAPDNEDEGEIADMTVKELKAYAAEKNIDLGNAKTKADIIAVIEAAEADSDEEVEEADDEDTPDNEDEGGNE